MTVSRHRIHKEGTVRKTIAILVALAAVALPTGAFGMGPALHATLLGKNETPPVSTKAHGTVTITFKATQVCWRFKLVGLRGATASHIHKGKPGVSGPVFVPLGAKFKATGCAAAAKSAIAAIKKNPGGFYVNVHTAKDPNGAIRGQL
jgi:hypothetical protein